MSRATGYTAYEILRQLDECAAEFTFPVLDNGYIYPGDVRLSSFRDRRRWAILIEVLGYHYRAGPLEGIGVTVYQFGNCLTGRPGFGPSIDPVTWNATTQEEADEEGALD